MVRRSLLPFVTLLVITFDQVIKYIVRARLASGESITLIEGILQFTRVHNTGAAFGLFPSAQLIIALLALAIVIVLLIYRKHIARTTISTIALGAIIGGALGNLADRLLLGYVLDFINFSFWPAFNIADIGVTVGSITLIIEHVLYSRRNTNNQNN